jgi:hypothetical protein
MNPHWQHVLEPGPSDPRAKVLAALPGYEQRLRELLADLELIEVIGIANRLFNDCDPEDLAKVRGGRTAQALAGWQFLLDAKVNPPVYGEAGWLGAKVLLEHDHERHLQRVRAMTLDAFVTAAMKVESGPYRTAVAPPRRR